MTCDFRVGHWLVQPDLNAVSHNGTSLRLEPKVMEVLVCLAHHAGRPATKEDLLHIVWPDTFVSDDVLVRSISELRRAFEDDAKEPRIIQTIPKRGYRLVAPVVPVDSAPVEASSTAFPLRLRRWQILGGITAIVALAVFAGWNAKELSGHLFARNGLSSIHSVAVLPMQNISGDPEQEYFADGMTEELITELSHISALRVISRTSVMRYKGSKKSLPEIAHELGVDGIVEGSVRRSGNEVRITAQLIYAPQDINLWAETYNRDLGNVLELQSEMANTIASAVKIKSTPQERERLKNIESVNVRALDAYLQGEYHLNRYGRGFGEEEDKAAISYFQQAVAAEPGFAQAYVGIANAYEGLMLPANQRWPMERAAAEEAVALDPNLAEAHFTMARVALFSEWDLPAAGREFKRAIELNPNNAEAHGWFACYLSSVGRGDDARTEARLAQQLDPVHYTHCAYNQPGDEDRAIDVLRNYVELNPEDGYAHMALADLYARKGIQKEHIGELQETALLFGFPDLAELVGQAYSASGYQGALRAWAEGLDHNGVNRPVMIAEAYSRLGDKDQALHWLERAYSEHDDDMVNLNGNSVWDPLRSDPRFKDLLRRVGLPNS